MHVRRHGSTLFRPYRFYAELINGRLAMLAFVAALGAELSSGESVLRQLADEPTGEPAMSCISAIMPAIRM